MTLTDKAKFRVFENKILRIIYGRIQDEESGKWRHNDELFELYGTPYIQT